MTGAAHPELVGITFGLLAAGFIVAIPTTRAIMLGLASRDWRMVKGRIRSSTLTTDSYGEDRDFTRGPKVVYSYQVEGVSYRGTRIAFAMPVPVISKWTTPIFGDPPDVREGLRVEDRVDVWYDPATPDQAVLRPGVSIGFWALALFGWVLLLAGGMMLPGVIAFPQGY